MRTKIRKEVFKLLFNKTAFGKRVYRSRRVPLSEDEETRDGVILIYLERESSTVINSSPVIYRRTLDLSIALIKTMDEEDSELIEDQLEEVGQEVERIMSLDDSLNGTCSGTTFNSYEFIEDESGHYKQGSIKLSFSIVYEVEVGATDSDLSGLYDSSISIKHEDHEDFKFNISHQDRPVPPEEGEESED